jgi:flagellar basal-body rod protein FlgG
MLEGLYTAAAGMAAQQQRMDALSNDVANVNTAGYKRVRVGFRDLIYQRTGPTGVSTGAGAAAVQLGRGFAQGSLQKTDEPLDLAIIGDGYFQVRRASNGQTALTRNGSFQVDATGQLTTPEGDSLVPPINIPKGIDPSSVTIGRDGTLTANGRRLGQIQLVTVPAPTGLAAAGNGYYTVTAASGGVGRTTTATLEQGVLESSNVDLADAMVDMMDAQRSYSMASKAIHMQDQMMEIANGIKS